MVADSLPQIGVALNITGLLSQSGADYSSLNSFSARAYGERKRSSHRSNSDLSAAKIFDTSSSV